MRRTAVTILILMLGACTAEQAHRNLEGACRASPSSCADPNAIPASRSAGL